MSTAKARRLGPTVYVGGRRRAGRIDSSRAGPAPDAALRLAAMTASAKCIGDTLLLMGRETKTVRPILV